MADSERSTTHGPLFVGDRPVPHNTEAEIAVLGSMLLDPANAIDVAVTRLSFTDSFYSPGHQKIFAGLVKLSTEKPRGAIDLITLTDALEKAGTLAEVGGAAYLDRLATSVPTAANIEQYAEIVHDTAVLRRLIRTGTEMLDKCYAQEEDVHELLDRIETEILTITGLRSGGETQALSDLVFPAINHLDRLHSGDRDTLGIQTGYADLDSVLTGLRPGEMLVLAARPSIGKTALALNMAANMALSEAAVPVGIFSLEMSADLLVLRLLCTEARVSLSDIREGALSTVRWQEIMDAGQRFRAAPIYIDDTGNLDIIELRARARRMKRQFDIQVLMIDYLQLLKASVGRNATRENEVARISGGIKALSKELGIPIVVMAQLNRQAEQAGQKPRLAHLRESGAIEQDADVVALLHRERDQDVEEGVIGREGMEAELIIAKHRNGPTGIVRLTFLPTYTRFESRSRIADADVPEL